MHHLPYSVARWVEGEGFHPKALKSMDNGMLVEDIKERPVILITNEWQFNWVRDRNPDFEFTVTPTNKRIV